MDLFLYVDTVLLVIVLVVFIAYCFIATIEDNKNKESTDNEPETFDDYCIGLYGKHQDELTSEELNDVLIAYTRG